MQGSQGGGLFTFSRDLEKGKVNKGVGFFGVIYYAEKKEKYSSGCF